MAGCCDEITVVTATDEIVISDPVLNVTVAISEEAIVIGEGESVNVQTVEETVRISTEETNIAVVTEEVTIRPRIAECIVQRIIQGSDTFVKDVPKQTLLGVDTTLARSVEWNISITDLISQKTKRLTVVASIVGNIVKYTVRDIIGHRFPAPVAVASLGGNLELNILNPSLFDYRVTGIKHIVER